MGATSDGGGTARLRGEQRPGSRTTPAPGREVDLRHVAEFLLTSPTGVSTLGIVGDAGIGKTHVWRAGLQALDASAATVMRTRAASDESMLDYVVLTDLLAAVPDAIFATLPGPQRRALEVVMLRRHPSPLEPHDRHAVGLALRELLVRAGDLRPVVVAIDDAHLVDAASAAALTFALRRVEDQPVRVLVTAPDERDVEQLVEPWHARPPQIVALDALPVDAFSALVGAHRSEALFPRRVSRLHAAVGGNPATALAILERLEQHAASAGRLDRFPIPARLEDGLAAALVDLPADVVEVLRVAATMSRPTVDAIAAVLGVQHAAVCLGRAVGDGVLELRDQRLRFVDPMLPSFLYHQMTVRQRLQLHRRLSVSLEDPAERALHHALSTRRPESPAAETVAQAALEAQQLGEHDAAAELAAEAVRLTPDTQPDLLHDRARLAATSLVASGDIAHAATLLEHTAGRRIPGTQRAELLLLLARLRSHTDHAASAVHLLRLALSESTEAEQRGRLAAELAGVFAHTGHLREAEHELELASESAAGDEFVTARRWVDLALGRAEGDPATAEPVATDPLLPASGQPLYVTAVIDLAAGRLQQARQRLEDLQRQLALRGDDLSAGHVLCRLSEVERISGNARGALQYADAACTVARRTGQRVLLPFALARRALVLGRMGRLDEARAAAEEGAAVALATGARRADWLNRWALGFAALSEGDAENAARVLTPLAQESVSAGFVEPAFLRWIPDAVEALVAVGDAGRAAGLLDPFEHHSRRLDRTWAVAVAQRSRALLLTSAGERAEAARLLDEAMGAYASVVDPFELARTMLAAGVLQRRQRHEAQAGQLLRGALELFEQLGAEAWASRLRHDLTAVAAHDDRPLTAVELRVAELASTGMTNRQIATQLFISPKTVETHLSSVYRKLGIRSRAGLAHQLESTGSSRPVSG